MEDYRRNLQYLTSERNYAENEAVKNAQVNDRIALEAKSNDASAKRYMDESQAYMRGQEHHMEFETNVISSLEMKEKTQHEEITQNASAMAACMAEMKLMRKKKNERNEQCLQKYVVSLLK